MVDGRTRNDSIVALGDATYVLRNPVHPRLACQSLLTGLVVGNHLHPHSTMSELANLQEVSRLSS